MSEIRKADHFKLTNRDDFRCFLPCNCGGECERFEKENVISDAIEMRVTGETIIKALAAVSVVTHKKIIEEEEYFQKYSDFLNNKDGISKYKENNDSIREDDNDNEEEDDCEDVNKLCVGCMCTFLALFLIGLLGLCALGVLKGCRS